MLLLVVYTLVPRHTKDSSPDESHVDASAKLMAVREVGQQLAVPVGGVVSTQPKHPNQQLQNAN